MLENKTVVIPCAGMGKRLGMNIPKALLEINGKTLIRRNLELLKDVKDVRIVVGYKAEEVIKEVLSYRKDVVFVFNRDYENTGTGASVSLAAKYANEYVITIDGDLLVHPNDIQKILEYKTEFAAGTDAGTDNPVLMSIKKNKVVDFSRDYGQYEWTGVCQFKSKTTDPVTGHTYTILLPKMPLDWIYIRTKEIDTPNDFIHAERWLKNNYSDNLTIGVVGGMGTVATVDYFARLVNAFPAEKEWDRPRFIIDNRCSMPSRVRGILYNERCEEIVDSLTESIKMMINNNCDYVVLNCNTSHYYLNDILEKNREFKGKVINIIDLCADTLNEKKVSKVDLLASEGTYLSKIYDASFEKFGISYNKVDKRDESKIRDFIEAVKQQKITKKIEKEFIDYVNGTPEKVVVLGCTELPVLYEKCAKSIKKKVVDPLQCSIEFLLSKQNEIAGK